MTSPEGRGFRIADAARVAELVDRVYVAVLRGRGGQEVPVRADWVGLRLDVGEGSVIEVQAPPYGERRGVVLRHRDEVDAGS